MAENLLALGADWSQEGLATTAWIGQAPPGDRLLGGLPHPNVLGAHPQHPARRHRRIGPVAHQGLGPARLAGQGFSPPYEIPHPGLKLPQVSAAFRAVLPVV
jgi:hypothetical protein